MKQIESIEVRTEMAHMHDEYLRRLDVAMEQKQYVEASWLCYAIFEQRIARIMKKHIRRCPRGKRSSNEKPVSITTKTICIKKLCKLKYGPYAQFDKKLMEDVEKWCSERNTLVHGLVSLDHYKRYDAEFKELAHSGQPLVDRLYEEAKRVRDWCNDGNSFGKFPEIKCRCKHRCIREED